MADFESENSFSLKNQDIGAAGDLEYSRHFFDSFIKEFDKAGIVVVNYRLSQRG